MDENSGPRRPHLTRPYGDKCKDPADWSGETRNEDCVEDVVIGGTNDDNGSVESKAHLFVRVASSKSGQPISEPPQDASCRGLSYPDLTPWRVVDAKTRSLITKWLLVTFSLTVGAFLTALVAAAFTGTPTSPFAGYFEWVISGLSSLVTLMLGYYVGTRHGRGAEDKN
jgi:hypothetical protein